MRRIAWTVAAVLAGSAALVGGLQLAARLDDGGEASDQIIGSAAADDPGVLHVHALGVNPADGLLYVATHTGLFRLGEEGGLTRIADRFQDTMGFTVVGPDRFYASGHPDLREDLPSRLGLIESTDAGETWRAVSMQGEADLHAIAHGVDVLYAADSTSGKVLASLDGGATWDERGTAPLAALAIDPADPDHLAGASYEGGLLVSTDGGRTWQPVAGPPVAALVWDTNGLTALAPDGTVQRAAAPQDSWDVVGQLGSPGVALATDSDRLYAATDTGALARSDDGGRTWTPLTAAT
ncbi:MAG: F510_1955 family glycosylhydrolase [Acidimicrobiia bacterium]